MLWNTIFINTLEVCNAYPTLGFLENEIAQPGLRYPLDQLNPAFMRRENYCCVGEELLLPT
jgi:hypothetical protein